MPPTMQNLQLKRHQRHLTCWLIIIYTCATKTDCELYPKLTNPARLVIDTSKSAEVITIDKIKHNMKLKEYAAYTVVETLLSNIFSKRYLDLKFLPTCSLVIISFSTNTLPYRCDNTLTPSSTNSIPTTSKLK